MRRRSFLKGGLVLSAAYPYTVSSSMSTYNTGNPVLPNGSSDPRDLLDNSQIIDVWATSREKTEHPDRLGVPRKTWHGMEQEFQQFLVNSGYTGTGAGGAYEDYDANGPLTITALNQIFTKDGEFYRLKPDQAMPYTTTDWATDEVNMVAVGDAALRQELSGEISEGRGAVMVNGSALSVATPGELSSLPISIAASGGVATVASGVMSGVYTFVPGDQASRVAKNPDLWIAPNEYTTSPGDSGAWKLDVRSKILTHQDGGSENKVQYFVSCVLRNDGSGWSFIDDSGHTPVNVDSVNVIGDEIVIDYSSLSADRVVSISVSSDERFVRDGIYGGASVNPDSAKIRVSAPLEFWVDAENGNVSFEDWWNNDISISYGGNYFEVTHPSVNIDTYFSTSQIGSASPGRVELGQTREATTRTRFYPTTTLWGRFTTDGSNNWTVAGSNSPGAVSASYSSGKLEVAHPAVKSGAQDIQITGRNPFIALQGSVSDTSFEVFFRNDSGQISAEHPSMAFSFSRGNVQCINSGAVDISPGYWKFSAPSAWLKDPNKLSNPLGNFWVICILEKDV